MYAEADLCLPANCIETRRANATMKTMPNKTDRNNARALLREAGVKLGTPCRSAFAGRVRELTRRQAGLPIMTSDHSVGRKDLLVGI